MVPQIGRSPDGGGRLPRVFNRSPRRCRHRVSCSRTAKCLPCRREQIDEHYRRYRLSSPEMEEEMVRSLRRWGQLAPITVSVREGLAETLDGFKRLAAARRTPGMTSLPARRLDADEREPLLGPIWPPKFESRRFGATVSAPCSLAPAEVEQVKRTFV